jgi:hypothetical protein
MWTVRDLLVNLLASVVAGTAVWLFQRLRRYRRAARKRAFFGIRPGVVSLLAVSRHASSPSHLSVHRQDVAALVELATIARDCGGRADLITTDDAPQGVGRVTEFCVGGPSANPRMAAHLRALLPGVRVELPVGPAPDGARAGARELPLIVGGTTFRREPDRVEYVALARVFGPDGGRPVFILNGQTARTNLAAARYLAARYATLFRRYGAAGRFCLVLRILEPDAYGADLAELVGDLTVEAFAEVAAVPGDRKLSEEFRN